MSEVRELWGPSAAAEQEEGERALIEAVRAGSVGAFGVLYERYRSVALRGAERHLAVHHRVLAEDVVEVVFASIYQALRRGSGPRGPFRSYLLLSVKREAVRQQRRRDRETVVDRASMDLVAASTRHSDQPALSSRSGPVVTSSKASGSAWDEQLDGEALFGEVFKGLNPRFRHALWLTEVEGNSAEELGALLDITPNAAAALCYRARRALRAGYLRAYERSLASPACRELIDELAAFIELGQPSVGHQEVRDHLIGCAACRDIVRGSARATSALAALAPFGLLGAGRWLDPEHQEATSGRARGSEAMAVAAVVLVVAGLLAVALWPSTRSEQGGGAAGSAAPASEQVPVPSGAPRPSEASSTQVPTTSLGPAPASERPASSAAVPDDDRAPAPLPAPPPDAGAEPTSVLGGIVGRLRADLDGSGPAAPIPTQGTPVRILDAADAPLVSTAVDERGDFEADGLPAGRYRVLVTPPVGMVLPGAPGGSDPTARREVEIASVVVVAGRDAQVSDTFVPWRTLDLRGGRASVPAAGAGDVVSWSFDLASAGAPTTEVAVEVVVARPRGTEVAVESSGATGGCTSVTETDASVAVRCRIRNVGVAPRPFTIRMQVVAAPNPGWLVPSITATPASGAAEAADLAGEAVAVRP